uniref:Uncharacterized protein n=1 Tax=Kalanchoe fedtschenkoi TaxID=63787 RepID=A0A7N0THA8_KALFE
MDHDKTGCQVPPEGPILCVNNCGFFGSPTTMNMCSMCHKDFTSKQEQANLAASSIGSIVNESYKEMKPALPELVTEPVDQVEPSVKPLKLAESSLAVKEGPSRCSCCRKRVGLTGFKCRCGNLFCGMHRYSDKHDCSFDYQNAGKDAIAKANPVVKAEKLNKI